MTPEKIQDLTARINTLHGERTQATIDATWNVAIRRVLEKVKKRYGELERLELDSEEESLSEWAIQELYDLEKWLEGQMKEGASCG